MPQPTAPSEHQGDEYLLTETAVTCFTTAALTVARLTPRHGRAVLVPDRRERYGHPGRPDNHRLVGEARTTRKRGPIED